MNTLVFCLQSAILLFAAPWKPGRGVFYLQEVIMNQPEGYADDVVKGFLTWSIVWGLVAVLIGVVISLQLAFPQLNLPPYLTYGRLRPIHTNAGIFGWGIGSFMAFFIYITQRLTRTRLWSPGLARFQLYLFNVVIALAAVTLLLGMNRSKEYAELEWPVALLVVVLWVIFSANIIMTIVKRREEQMYIDRKSTRLNSSHSQ